MDEMELLASVFESSLDAKFIIFSNGNIYRANRAAEQVFFGAIESDLADKNLFKLVAGESRKSLKKFLFELRSARQIHREIELKVNGETGVFDVIGNAGIMPGLHLIIMRDITERVRDRESRDQFIAIAGHELKTPLAVISAYTDLLKRRYKDDPSISVYLNKISGKNKILTEYIDSIMDEIRIGAGKFSFDDKPTDFDALVKTTVEELAEAYPAAKLSLAGKTGKTANVDGERIAQVIRNLVVNAIKHSPKSKEIKIALKAKAQSVYLSVTDQGRGISKKEQASIFKAFYRSNHASKNWQPGLGLGLYIAKQIVRKYGGNVGVVSKLGEGAKFYFEIPTTS